MNELWGSVFFLFYQETQTQPGPNFSDYIQTSHHKPTHMHSCFKKDCAQQQSENMQFYNDFVLSNQTSVNKLQLHRIKWHIPKNNNLKTSRKPSSSAETEKKKRSRYIIILPVSATCYWGPVWTGSSWREDRQKRYECVQYDWTLSRKTV